MLQQASFGPFTRGVIDRANPSLPLQGACRSLQNAIYTGGNKLSVRPGTVTALTLKDDQGTPADVTSVCAIAPFMDEALAVAHSTVTQKVYLYRLKATMDDWYNAAGVLQGTTSPQPIGSLWTGTSTAPDVLIAEGLGTAYIAHTTPADSAGLYYPTKTFVAPGTIATLTADLDSSGGAEDLYFAGVISFQQHLWAWGFGAGTTVGYTTYRPELARFSGINFGAFSAADSVTLGDRVRSARERIIGAGIAGEALFLGGETMLTRITGYGRNSWEKHPVDKSYGFVGPKCMVTVGDTLYYASIRGPMRITAYGDPDRLWAGISGAWEAVTNRSRIVAGYDQARDQVLFSYDSGSGVRTFAAFDVARDAWVGPDADLGLAIRCAAVVEPYTLSTASPPAGPTAPPSAGSTSSVGTSTATASWTNGDSAAQTVVEVGTQASGSYTVATTVAAGVTGYTFSGLTAGTAYQWRVRHVKNGQYSAYYGPVVATQFTTTASGGGALVAPSSCTITQDTDTVGANAFFIVEWINSGESGVSTEVYTSRNGASYSLQTTQATGVSSVELRLATAAGETMGAEVRHVKSGETPSSYAVASPVTVV